MRRLHRIPPPEPISGDHVDLGPSPVEEAIGRENLERYERALQRLDETDREAIVLRIELGYDYVELARALGKPTPDAARMAVSRAVGRLAREIARER